MIAMAKKDKHIATMYIFFNMSFFSVKLIC